MIYNQSVEVERGFTKMAFLLDRDQDQSDDAKLTKVVEYFQESGVTIQPQNRSWVEAAYASGFGVAGGAPEQIKMSVLSLIIPFNTQGALETFLMQALSEVEDDKQIIDACCDFVTNVQSVKYLTSDRLRLKAQLGATFALMYPDKVFTRIHEPLRQIPWENYRTIQDGFQMLEQI